MLPSLTFFLVFASSVLAQQQQRLWSSAFAYPGVNATYDYVVVGGGTAGLAIAARLAESYSVAVVEAGGFYEVENGNNSVVPLLSLTGIAFIDPTATFVPQPLMDWSLVSIPQTNAASRRIHYAQGKTLGGSSAINTLTYIRTTNGSCQLWADQVGDQSYTFQNLLKYYEKSVHLTPPNQAKRVATNATPQYDPSVFSPSGGPLQVSWVNYVDPTITWLAKAIQNLGLSINPKNHNSGELKGGAYNPATIDPTHAFRSSSESSFLRYAINRTGIMVYTHTQALKLQFNTSNTTPKATSVLVSTQGLQYALSARKEIIVSAGVMHSPQLLMVSGIGPKSTLQSHGIQIVADRPGVGQNLWDPIQIGIGYSVNTPSAQSLTANPATVQQYLQQYLNNASGPFSSAAGYITFEKYANSSSNFTASTRAKLASLPADAPTMLYVGGSFAGTNYTTTALLASTLQAPFSRGNVTISSASMTDNPVINLGWLSDPADAELLLAGFKRLRQAFATISEIEVGPEVRPGAAVQTDAQILDFIRNNCQQIWHATTTCAMGKTTDSNAVVDSKAKVIGVSGLRVVDASVLPAIPGFPQATIYMLAEKIADNIKNGQ